MFGFFPTRKKTPSQRVRRNWDWSSNDFDPWAIRSGGIPQFISGGEALPMWGGLLGLTALIASMTGGAPWSSKSSPSS